MKSILKKSFLFQRLHENYDLHIHNDEFFLSLNPENDDISR